jgi:outer membrane protein TolC
MTQLALGLVQRFPRGDSRSLRGAQLRDQGLALEAAAGDLALRSRLTVREEYFEILKQRQLAQINQEAEAVFGDLEDITRDYYATGRVQQQDVLRAEVERSRVRERATGITEEEERARARLAVWIGDLAWRQLDGSWPSLPQTRPLPEILDNLSRHPRLQALQQQVLAAERGVSLAEQAYRPEFAVDLTYGGRGGTNMDGSDRADLFSVMVTMDLPLFTAERQDRAVAARVAETSAAAFDRDDAHRRLLAEVHLQARTLARQRERLALFETELLPEASFNSEATYSAYQAAVENLSTLMRAHITRFDLQMEHARLQAEALKTQARLLYLQEVSP